MDLAYMAALPMKDFAQRRAKVFEQMQEDSLFLVFSDIERRRNDGCDYPFRQDSYFWYLTGFNEPNSALLLRKQQGEQQAIMFVRPSDKLLEIWNGPPSWRGQCAANLVSGYRLCHRRVCAAV